MRTDLEISIYEIVGNERCVASSDGQKVYDRLVGALKEQRRVVLSFRNVALLTSAFLNAAIGQLYGEFSEQEIRALLRVEDISADDVALLKRVVDTAKQYFKDPNKFDQALRNASEDDDNEL